MIKKEILTNLEIYNYAQALNDAFQSPEEIKFPVKVGFFIQKNMKNIVDIANDVEKSRIAIIQRYGVLSEEDENKIVVPADKTQEANEEIKDLFDIKQELSIYMLDLEVFDNIDMTAQQIAAISFMINEDEEENIEV